MDTESLLWAAKSGIQKAIRRSDLNLAKTCFEVLWKEPKGRSWLKWRLPILVEEEMWYFTPECFKFLKDHSDLKNHEAKRKPWLKFIYTLCLMPKSKDSEPLYYLAMSNAKPPNAEVADFRKLLKDNAGKSAYDIAKALSQRAMSGDIGLTDYEMAGVELMVTRSKSGGLPTDPWACLSCIYLIYNRGIGEYEVQAKLKEAYKGVSTKPERLMVFPWWIFDMHTRIGKKMIRRFPLTGELDFMTHDLLEKVVFLFESAYVPREKIDAQDVKAEADCFESILWVPYMKNELSGHEKPVKEIKRLWKASIRPKLEKSILSEMGRTGASFTAKPEQKELPFK